MDKFVKIGKKLKNVLLCTVDCGFNILFSNCNKIIYELSL